MKRLALIGSKDFAEQIQILAEETGEYKVVGYFDDFEKKGTLIRSLPILGKIEDIETEYRNLTVFFLLQVIIILLLENLYLRQYMVKCRLLLLYLLL